MRSLYGILYDETVNPTTRPTPANNEINKLRVINTLDGFESRPAHQSKSRFFH
jgi:hypothetical protein